MVLAELSLCAYVGKHLIRPSNAWSLVPQSRLHISSGICSWGGRQSRVWRAVTGAGEFELADNLSLALDSLDFSVWPWENTWSH